MINHEALQQLIACPSNDSFVNNLLVDCLKSFEQYHEAVYELEMTRRLLAPIMDTNEYQERIQGLDHTRTIRHNAVITNVRMMNRLAEKNGLPLIYDGVVSEDRPYRRELANAVFEYVEWLIQNRM